MRLPKRRETILKYLAIQERYKYLYEVQRMRHDDVVKQLCTEFYISNANTIYNILATDCSEMVPITRPKRKKRK